MQMQMQMHPLNPPRGKAAYPPFAAFASAYTWRSLSFDSRMHSTHPPLNVTRSALCPRLHASPVKYLGNPSASASCLVRMTFRIYAG